MNYSSISPMELSWPDERSLRDFSRGDPHSARPPQLSRAGYHPSHPRWAAAAQFDSTEAPRALTSAACLARSADHARLWLSPIRVQNLLHIKPGEGRLRWDRRGILADPISGPAVLEYGPTEILPPVGAISKHPSRLCRRGRQASRAHPRGKPGLSTFEGGCGRETELSAGGRRN